MRRGAIIKEKTDKMRSGLVTDYDEVVIRSTGERAHRWCEIMWSDCELECFDSLIPDWDKWNTIEIIK